ncbi:BREX-2 system adenine-specific DNA-methyltransferase PglX [Nocardia noduli]|uniref:BREX-2 system adenine-specific DNA-methyltransferase PglX n=1 Tax=Nocardia noduli TaxID=2815722 RepID=UPI001C221C22|nr:BREX-2 system adenine-specific DNA-methyltransferase PglX [Nocardia noduli]
MIDRAALLTDLKKQVTAVEGDLHKQLRALPEVKARLHDEWAQAKKLKRTAATETSWLDERVTQVAVAWVLGSVFVRFCEDNHLVADPYLTGSTDDRRELAHARYDAYVESDPDPTYRGWLEHAFAELGAGQAGKLLFDPNHNALYQIPLSHDGARELIEFWRTRDGLGVLVHDFTDPLDDDGIEGWDTRFLGDLYQDLSEDIRKNYALLQTPEFVEEFILDRTLEPALREFGYADIKLIDPTCGSGHFVLGAFRRLTRKWADEQPTKDRHERVHAALSSVHGVDINPFAIAIARFRLLVAAMAAANVRTLAQAARYEWPIKLAVGDSLIKARQLELTFDGDQRDPLAEHSYATEDVHEYPGILESGRYHVVVGNPPYITPKDKSLNELYRGLYKTCSGLYALTIPFAQRFFELARLGDSEGRRFGRVGQITANSFMKREFGSKLIAEFFAHTVELTEIIDTSGAYIPGHGTPTVILIGTRRSGKIRGATIRTVRSARGEPEIPSSPSNGLVWRAIVENIDKAPYAGQWISADNLARDRHFSKPPWILLDQGREVLEAIEGSETAKLGKTATRIGFVGMTHADEIMVRKTTSWPVDLKPYIRAIGSGTDVRDWVAHTEDSALFPYDNSNSFEPLPRSAENSPGLWPFRNELGNRATFSGETYFKSNRTWYEWHQIPKDQNASSWSISYAEVATHNHFALDRGGKVFKQTAPVIKLPEGASEEEHLQLLNLLNSSTACFWLKMTCHSKGSGGVNEGLRGEKWEEFYQFNSTSLKQFPIPSNFTSISTTPIECLVQQLENASPAILCRREIPTGERIREIKERWHIIRGKMIATQEELDWQTYSQYGLSEQDLTAGDSDLPTIDPGERAFEIVLARCIANGTSSSEWFSRHRYAHTAEVPSHWPESYKNLVRRRIEVIESNRAIGMIERPEYKRRWATEGWDAMQEKALRSWLLDRMESRDIWFDDNTQPRILTLSRLTDRLAADTDFVSVAALYAPHTDLSKVVADLITEEHVPFVAALRYKPSGLKKRADWEHVWDMQRQEDAMPDGHAKNTFRDTIPVPPKYTSADFVRTSFWQARGKLDVPKERFISYGATNVGTPGLYGWAGWDHREQAMAIAIHLAEHSLSAEEITPFLTGLLELQPWLDQWHNEVDPDFGIAPSTFLAGDRRDRQDEHGLTDDALREWRPQAPVRGRRTTTARTTKKKAAVAEGEN